MILALFSSRGLRGNFAKRGDASVPTPLHTTPAPTRLCWRMTHGVQYSRATARDRPYHTRRARLPRLVYGRGGACPRPGTCRFACSTFEYFSHSPAESFMVARRPFPHLWNTIRGGALLAKRATIKAHSTPPLPARPYGSRGLLSRFQA